MFLCPCVCTCVRVVGVGGSHLRMGLRFPSVVLFRGLLAVVQYNSFLFFMAVLFRCSQYIALSCGICAFICGP